MYNLLKWAKPKPYSLLQKGPNITTCKTMQMRKQMSRFMTKQNNMTDSSKEQQPNYRLLAGVVHKNMAG